MKQEGKSYEEWLAEIRRRPPVMSNPDELTASILQQVDRMPLRKKRRRLLMGSWLSGIAAGVLLCLLAGETLFAPVPYDVRPMGESRLQQNGIYSLPEGWKEMRLSEKSDYLSGQYMRFKKLRQSKVMELTRKTY